MLLHMVSCVSSLVIFILSKSFSNCWYLFVKFRIIFIITFWNDVSEVRYQVTYKTWKDIGWKILRNVCEATRDIQCEKSWISPSIKRIGYPLTITWMYGTISMTLIHLKSSFIIPCNCLAVPHTLSILRFYKKKSMKNRNSILVLF